MNSHSRAPSERAGWRWSNVPIPEGFLAAIIAGMVLQRFRPSGFLARPHAGRVTGALTLAGGIVLAAWAVSAVDGVETAEPTRVVTDGPYALTRNPMYLAWTLIGVGVAFILNTRWLLLLLPAALAYTHFHEIPREEWYLHERFPEEYPSYTARVRRWL